MSSWLLVKIVSAWLLPPGIFIVIGLSGCFVARKRSRLGKSLIAVSLILLWACSTQWVADVLLRSLEPASALDLVVTLPAQVIVVLGGGRNRGAPEYGGDTVSEGTLVRARYGAYLHRTLDKPLLVSGGNPDGGTVTEAQAMKSLLENEFKVPVAWMETRSNTTYDQAREVMAILGPLGKRRIYLITHAWHMPRAQTAFEQAGFDVVPASTSFVSRRDLTLRNFVPSAPALRDTNYYFHEMLGLAWYRLKSPAK